MKKITAGRFEYLPARGEGYSHLHDTKTDTWLTAGASEFYELAKEILRHESESKNTVHAGNYNGGDFW